MISLASTTNSTLNFKNPPPIHNLFSCKSYPKYNYLTLSIITYLGKDNDMLASFHFSCK